MGDVSQSTATFHDPCPQSFYTFRSGMWHQASGSDTPTSETLLSLKLLSWNIDFQAPHGRERMLKALDYLQQAIESLPPEVPAIILLQEITDSDLVAIKNSDWIRQQFHITEINTRNWLSSYGTITIIDRRLRISMVFRIRYLSDMGRDALFVDIEDAEHGTIRFCNTHLESLPRDPPLRPEQVKLASRYLKDPTADGAVIAGDFNAIEDFDKSLPVENGLKDAYLTSGGKEGHQDGWTWGMQSPDGGGLKFGCSRMDKVLFCGRVSVQNLVKIGAGVKVEVKWFEHFVTDHLGLMADVILEQ